MKIHYILVLLLVSVILILTVIQVAVSNKLSTAGVDLGKLNDKIAALRYENQKLNEIVLINSSYTMVASQAAQLGFVDTKTRIYVTSSIPIALMQ